VLGLEGEERSGWVVGTIERQNLVDSVIAELRQMIRDGTFLPAEKLPSQAALAKGLGVGRSSIREAMQALRLLGLVEVSPGRGSYVRESPMRIVELAAPAVARLRELHIAEVWEARFAVETAIASLAAQRISLQQIGDMRSALQGMEENEGNPTEFARYDLQFHLVTADAAGNRVLAGFYHQSRQILGEVMVSFVTIPGVQEASIGMAEAIGNRDPAAAVASVEARRKYVNQVLATYGMQSDARSFIATNAVGKEDMSRRKE
jgi:DNA-binding FadR family transcriptional regulator